MAIKTISISQGQYTALQGYWDWDESEGFVFVSYSRPYNDQSKSTFGSTRPETPPTLVPYNTPSDYKPAQPQSTDGPRDYFSFIEPPNDTNKPANDDTVPSSLDSSLASIEFDPPTKLNYSGQQPCGLAISGLMAKDGNGPFTGLGIVSVRSSPWRTLISPADGADSSNDFCGEETPGVSDTLLQETLLTFNDGPFLGHSLEPIPECDSWYSIDVDLDSHPTSTPALSVTRTKAFSATHSPQFIPNPSHEIPARLSSVPRFTLTRDLTSPTISSELRRVTGPRNQVLFQGCVSRPRSCLYAPESLFSTNHASCLRPTIKRSRSEPYPVKHSLQSSHSQSSRSSGLHERAYTRPRTVSIHGVDEKIPGVSQCVNLNGKIMPRWR